MGAQGYQEEMKGVGSSSDQVMVEVLEGFREFSCLLIETVSGGQGEIDFRNLASRVPGQIPQASSKEIAGCL